MTTVKMPRQHDRRIMLIRHRNTLCECLYWLIWITFSVLVFLGLLWATEKVVAANMVLADNAVERQELNVKLEAEKRKDEERKAAMNSVCKTDRVKCRIILTRW